MNDLEDELQSINTEIRYITLELMKLSEKSGKTFNQIAKEYIENAQKLYKIINKMDMKRANKKKMGKRQD